LPRASLDRSPQSQAQEGIEMSTAEVMQINPLYPAVPPQTGHQVRHRLTGAHGGDQEYRRSRGQIRQQGK